MNPTTDISLLHRLAGDVDPAAWAQFHARYHALILGFCARSGLQEADREDVAQEVLLSLCRALRNFSYQPERGRFRSYLKTVVVHAIAQRFRQNGRSRALLIEAAEGEAAELRDDEVWEEEWQKNHLRRAMERLMATISVQHRRAFIRYAMEGASVEETCRELGLTTKQVYTIKSRTLKQLRALIAEQVAEEG